MTTREAHYRKFMSLCARDPLTPGDGNRAHLPPVYATSTYVYEGVDEAMQVFRGEKEAYIYGRWHNPTVAAVEEKVAALEGLSVESLHPMAVMFSSGMAAIHAILQALKLQPGEAIITQGNLYGTTTELLNDVVKSQGVQVIYTDLKDEAKLKKLIKDTPNARLLYIETPANPTIDCYNLKALSQLAREHGLKTVCDNTFASPVLQQPLRFGIDFVVHSATKFLNGHGTGLSGFVVGADRNFMQQEVWKMRKLMGANSNGFDAFLLNNGIKTLPLRVRQHCENAMAVAQFLQEHPNVQKVNYVGLPSHPDHALAAHQMADYGGMLSFEVKGGYNAAVNTLKNIKFCTLTATLGTPDTIIQHPAGMTHIKVPKEQLQQYGISEGLIRMSIGLENPEDIIRDLEQSLV